MNEAQRLLDRLPARSVRSLLDTLLALRARARVDLDTEVPLVTLYLRNGRSLTGWIIDEAKDPNGRGLLLHSPGDVPHQPELDLHYVDPGAIDAITVIGAGAIADTLSNGVIGALPSAPPPSRLQLRQRAEAMQKSFAADLGVAAKWQFDSSALPDDLMVLAGSAHLLRETAAALRAIARKDVPGLQIFMASS